jgi:hypothetical protein
MSSSRQAITTFWKGMTARTIFSSLDQWDTGTKAAGPEERQPNNSA